MNYDGDCCLNCGEFRVNCICNDEVSDSKDEICFEVFSKTMDKPRRLVEDIKLAIEEVYDKSRHKALTDSIIMCEDYSGNEVNHLRNRLIELDCEDEK